MLRMTSSPLVSHRSSALRWRAACLLAVLAALFGVLLTFVRPWYLDWGASAEERRALLPGSEHMPGAINGTRAIDILAPAPVVFAWVSQLGQNRGGFYSYTLLEDLVGCEMPDVRRLDPALQRWSVGDRLWMYPSDELDGMGHAVLSFYEPGRALVFGTHTPADTAGSAPSGGWAFVVEPTSPNSSRLITRGSGGSLPSLLGAAYTRTVFEPLHFAMERRMLEGIRGLAEGRPISRASDLLTLFSWFVSFVLFVGAGVLVLQGSRFERSLLGFALAGLSFEVVTLVQPLPIVSVLLVIGACVIVWPAPRQSIEHECPFREHA